MSILRADLPPGFVLHAHDRLGSTQDEAKRLALEGAPDGTLVAAGEQTAGRGRKGRPWSSPPGNLYVSAVLRPGCPAAHGAQLGFVAAVALGEALETLLPAGTEIRYKWPNDVLVGERKIAGILLESALTPSGAIDWAVLGLGVNVAGHPPDAEFPATHMEAEGARDATPGAVLSAFAGAFARVRRAWHDHGFAPLRRIWLERAWRLGEEVSVRTGDNERLTGVFRDLGADGAMVLQLAGGGERSLSYGDVFPAEG